jgi:uncharacterized OB-fold protein
MIEGIPLPARGGPYEHGFWEALDAGVLVHQRCDSCAKWTFPPRWRCVCGGALQYQPVSGKGRLWSWTQVHAPVLPAFAPLTPYIAAIVELEEQADLRMVGLLVLHASDAVNEIIPADLHVGMPLEAVIAPLGAGVNWPQWKIPPKLAERQSHD